MCAIIDANIAHEVFGSNRPAAGQHFFAWLSGPHGRLVVGGKLQDELVQSSRAYQVWAVAATSVGKLRYIDRTAVAEKSQQIESQGIYRSDDPHILALAQISGARLLYSNDGNLHSDFKNRRLVDPQGKVYSTRRGGRLTPSHRQLLNDRDVCARLRTTN